MRDLSPSALYIRADPASPGHKEMNARKFLVFTDLFDVDISIESPTEGDQEDRQKMRVERHLQRQIEREQFLRPVRNK